MRRSSASVHAARRRRDRFSIAAPRLSAPALFLMFSLTLVEG
jgi:hypothetical protein